MYEEPDDDDETRPATENWGDGVMGGWRRRETRRRRRRRRRRVVRRVVEEEGEAGESNERFVDICLRWYS